MYRVDVLPFGSSWDAQGGPWPSLAARNVTIVAGQTLLLQLAPSAAGFQLSVVQAPLPATGRAVAPLALLAWLALGVALLGGWLRRHSS